MRRCRCRARASVQKAGGLGVIDLPTMAIIGAAIALIIAAAWLCLRRQKFKLASSTARRGVGRKQLHGEERNAVTRATSRANSAFCECSKDQRLEAALRRRVAKA